MHEQRSLSKVSVSAVQWSFVKRFDRAEDVSHILQKNNVASMVTFFPVNLTSMTLPKKGLRKITHGGHTYGWLIRKKPTWNQGHKALMTLAIQHLECDVPTVLHVRLNITRPDNYFTPHQTQIRPIHIRNMIDAATEAGWVSDVGGAAVEFEYSGVIMHA